MEYNVKIIGSTRELTPRERVKAKNFSNAIRLDEAIPSPDDAPLSITVDYCVEMEVHNEKSNNKEYRKFLIYDTEGNKYVTGSEAFWKELVSITEELEGTGETIDIEVFKLPSKNYSGKAFITCSLV